MGIEEQRVNVIIDAPTAVVKDRSQGDVRSVLPPVVLLPDRCENR